jgi:hypothetical protein
MNAKRKRGRPETSGEKLLPRSFSARDREWRAIIEAATQAGMPRSLWIRLALLRAARRKS